MQELTVTQLNKYVSSVLKGDKNLKNVLIKGEISNYVHHSSGHRYFSLKDSESAIKAVMFRYAAEKVRFELKNGVSVIVKGNITLYERDGTYQIQVTEMFQEGVGKEITALEELKQKLLAEGLFAPEHKRKIPVLPKKIGVVTSLTGAAIHDIENTLARRYPLCELYEISATVQGENAPESICSGIAKAESAGCDVIIVGRGGGSSEDLNAFDTESVARAVYNCKVPVISAVGHEINFTLTDLTADVRAATPTAAAEIASKYDIQQIMNTVNVLAYKTESAMKNIADRKSAEFSAIDARLNAQSPENRLKLLAERLDNIQKNAETAVIRRIDRAESNLAEKIGRLESLSPLKVMARGYSLAYKGGSLVRNTADLAVGDNLVIRFDKGIAEAEVKKIR